MDIGPESFQFVVISKARSLPDRGQWTVYLLENSWDDWFTYSTTYTLYLFLGDKVRHLIGEVKIGQFGMAKGQRRPALPSGGRTTLGDDFFSLGQDASYYESLNALGPDVRSAVLTLMRDVAADLQLWRKCKKEEVTQSSLLRSVLETSVEGQFHRMSQGAERLTRYCFSYRAPKVKECVPYSLDFQVIPESSPPTNVHVLIGRNGVGKTRLMSSIAKALLVPTDADRRWGVFSWEDVSDEDGKFTNLVTVSFSAFDDEGLMPDVDLKKSPIPFAYIGLRRKRDAGKEVGVPKSFNMLCAEFVDSLRECQVAARKPRWVKAVKAMSSDPIFHEDSVLSLIDLNLDNSEENAKAAKIFSLLSSGHKIVMLTLTRLVECVQAKTLVLVDELEAHLHPPLLASLVRSLSELLVERNAVAIIATHSPVVLQEVPRQCVWMLSRFGTATKAERPATETFGENVSVLTHAAFKLELQESGYYKLLKEMVGRKKSFDSALEEFDHHLGNEAKAVLRALYFQKELEDLV